MELVYADHRRGHPRPMVLIRRDRDIEQLRNSGVSVMRRSANSARGEVSPPYFLLNDSARAATMQFVINQNFTAQVKRLMSYVSLHNTLFMLSLTVFCDL